MEKFFYVLNLFSQIEQFPTDYQLLSNPKLAKFKYIW